MAKIALDSDQKKKVYVLAALAGLLGIGGLVVLTTSGKSGSSDATETPVTTVASDPATGAAPGAPTSEGVPPAGAPATGAPATAGVAGATTMSPLSAAERYRPDPFEQYYTKVDPPPPPPPTPVPLPPPVELPQPDSVGGGNDGGGFGNGAVGLLMAGGASSSSPALVGLPQARISRLVDVPSAPRVQVPPPNRSGGQGTISRSGNKRLAGVVIGDSVRALLEIQGAGPDGENITRVVQPGDEVEGVRVLRIERFTEGANRTRVRMIVRENGEERSVELRPAPQPLAGPGGEEGYPGGSSGYPGGSSGYPGGRPGFSPGP